MVAWVAGVVAHGDEITVGSAASGPGDPAVVGVWLGGTAVAEDVGVEVRVGTSVARGVEVLVGTSVAEGADVVLVAFGPIAAVSVGVEVWVGTSVVAGADVVATGLGVVLGSDVAPTGVCLESPEEEGVSG